MIGALDFYHLPPQKCHHTLYKEPGTETLNVIFGEWKWPGQASYQRSRVTITEILHQDPGPDALLGNSYHCENWNYPPCWYGISLCRRVTRMHVRDRGIAGVSCHIDVFVTRKALQVRRNITVVTIRQREWWERGNIFAGTSGVIRKRNYCHFAVLRFQ